ncbi:MAG TPA: MFS transporter [Puia sp.]|jgi:UMF1 family MFS transporter|nr:MFS transporter [Puia sp.]
MQTASKKVIRGWAMYDWANSVYNLVITTTFFPIYFTAVTKKQFGSDIVPFLGRKFVNSSLYDYSLAVAYLFIALLYPVLTSIADTRGNKKAFMKFFCYMGSAGCALLYFFNGANLWLGILCFMMASMGFVGSLVFYNAFLPEIAAPEDQDRVSAKGFTYGYIGSVILQLIGFALVILLPSDPFLAPRITFLLVGIWWASFAQITFAALPETRTGGKIGAGIISESFSEMKKVYQAIRKLPVLKNFLRGYFFYSMGVQTVMLAATLFGSKLLQLPSTNLIITIVVIQLVAIPGAIWMSRLSERFGNLRVLTGIIMFWILICLAAYYTAYYKEQGGNPEFGFYGLAIAVGLVMGGIQSLSRSTYSKLMPETRDTASYFSYYDFTEKLAIVIGMFSFGLIEEMTGSMKNSVLSLIAFFVLGLVWLSIAQRLKLKV